MVDAADIVFDAEEHRYWCNGREYPSVTRIIAAAGLSDARWYTDRATRRGTIVHTVLAWEDTGRLVNPGAIPPEIQPYWVAWLDCLKHEGWAIAAVEKRVIHGTWGYAGTLDRLVTNGAGTAVVDIKTGAPEPWHAIQTAAYAETMGCLPMRCAVYLRDDGTYRLTAHTDPDDRRVWSSCITTYNWRLKHAPDRLRDGPGQKDD
jgi:hypothetical protein